MERVRFKIAQTINEINDFIRGALIMSGTTTAGTGGGGGTIIKDETPDFAGYILAGVEVGNFFYSLDGSGDPDEAAAITTVTDLNTLVVPVGSWATERAYEIRNAPIRQDKIVSLTRDLKDKAWVLAYYKDDGYTEVP